MATVAGCSIGAFESGSFESSPGGASDSESSGSAPDPQTSSTGIEPDEGDTRAAADTDEVGSTTGSTGSRGPQGSGSSDSSGSSGESSSTGPQGGCDAPLGEMLPASAPDATVGAAYTLTMAGPDLLYQYEWFILPWEPPGLDFSVANPAASSSLGGTPTEAGDFDFTVIANPTGEDCVNADALIKEYTLTVR